MRIKIDLYNIYIVCENIWSKNNFGIYLEALKFTRYYYYNFDNSGRSRDFKVSGHIVTCYCLKTAINEFTICDQLGNSFEKLSEKMRKIK